MTAQTNALWVAALIALLLLAIPTSLLVREMMTETACDPGQVMLLLVYMVLALSVAGLFFLCISTDARSQHIAYSSLKGGKSMGMKETYHEKMETQLKEWSAKIDQLMAKVEHVSADLRLKYQKQIDALREKQAAARHKLDELKVTGESAWEEVKEGTERVWQELKEAFEKARARLQ
jgi:hypothetical protein